MIGRPRFTQLYDRVHKYAFTKRNKRSRYHKTGLYPYDPNIVLDTIDRPSLVEEGQEVVSFNHYNILCQHLQLHKNWLH